VGVRIPPLALPRRPQPTCRPVRAGHLGGAAGPAGCERPRRAAPPGSRGRGPRRRGPPVAQDQAQRRRHGRLPGPFLTAEPGTSCKQLSWWEPRSPTAPRVEGSGRPVLACPTPAASAPPTNPACEMATAGDLIQSGRLRWLCRLPLGVCRHAMVSTVPRVQGQGRPSGQTVPGGSTMTEASVGFAGNLTDDPGSATPRAGSPGPSSRGRVRPAGAGGVVLGL
jgi:hypothetical protein